MRETVVELAGSDAIDRVIFACFGESVYSTYIKAAEVLA
jgi:hypothetical protein